MNTRILIMVVMIFLSGCSRQGVYDNIQMDNQRRCESVPMPEYQDCIDASSQSYEEYERQRQELLSR